MDLQREQLNSKSSSLQSSNKAAGCTIESHRSLTSVATAPPDTRGRQIDYDFADRREPGTSRSLMTNLEVAEVPSEADLLKEESLLDKVERLSSEVESGLADLLGDSASQDGQSPQSQHGLDLLNK